MAQRLGVQQACTQTAVPTRSANISQQLHHIRWCLMLPVAVSLFVAASIVGWNMFYFVRKWQPLTLCGNHSVWHHSDASCFFSSESASQKWQLVCSRPKILRWLFRSFEGGFCERVIDYKYLTCGRWLFKQPLFEEMEFNGRPDELQPVRTQDQRGAEILKRLLFQKFHMS